MWDSNIIWDCYHNFCSVCCPCVLGRFKKVAPVAQLAKHWICKQIELGSKVHVGLFPYCPFWKLKIAGLILGLEYPCLTISIHSALHAVPVFFSRLNERAPSPRSSVSWAIVLWLESFNFKFDIEKLYETVNIFTAPCAVPVFWRSFKKWAPVTQSVEHLMIC